MRVTNEIDLPELSVVIPSVNGWADLNRCLGALEHERASVRLQVLVPERCGAAVANQTIQRFPWARVIPVPVATSIPQMRAIGIAEAQAPSVAIIEDHVIVREGWARAMVEARTNEARVVGAGLDNTARDNIVDWAAWLCEYNHLVGAVPSGAVEGLHGNHTVYDRALLTEFGSVVASGRWEDALHSAFRDRGIVLWSRPDIVAGHEKHYTVAEYTTQRFYYSRAYAALRVSGAGIARRVMYGLMAFTLPPLLFYRIVSRVWRGRRYRAHLIPSLPLLLLFVCSWGLGEVAGAWLGDGGALAKVA